MTVRTISDMTPVVDHYMAQIRDVTRQQDKLRFNYNIERLGEILAIEAGKFLQYRKTVVTTPFGQAELNVLETQPILYAIVRAGVQLQNGVRRIFDEASCGFCTCVKNQDGTRSTQLHQSYDVNGKTVVISDPLMTTGIAMSNTIAEIRKCGKPLSIIILNVISTPLALENLKHGEDADLLTVLTCAIDDFTQGIRGTIPGLGDAGDLSFGVGLPRY